MHGASAAHRTALVSGKSHIKFGLRGEKKGKKEKKEKKKDWKRVRTFRRDETPPAAAAAWLILLLNPLPGKATCFRCGGAICAGMLAPCAGRRRTTNMGAPECDRQTGRQTVRQTANGSASRTWPKHLPAPRFVCTRGCRWCAQQRRDSLCFWLLIMEYRTAGIVGSAFKLILSIDHDSLAVLTLTQPRRVTSR